MRTRSKNNIFKPLKKFSYAATKYPLPPTLKPTTAKQVLQDPKWRDAMCDEMNALLRINTWDLVLENHITM